MGTLILLGMKHRQNISYDIFQDDTVYVAKQKCNLLSCKKMNGFLSLYKANVVCDC